MARLPTGTAVAMRVAIDPAVRTYNFDFPAIAPEDVIARVDGTTVDREAYRVTLNQDRSAGIVTFLTNRETTAPFTLRNGQMLDVIRSTEARPAVDLPADGYASGAAVETLQQRVLRVTEEIIAQQRADALALSRVVGDAILQYFVENPIETGTDEDEVNRLIGTAIAGLLNEAGASALIRTFARVATSDAAARTALATLMAAATQDSERFSYDDLKDTPDTGLDTTALRAFALAATSDAAARMAVATLMAAATQDTERLSYDDLKDKPILSGGGALDTSLFREYALAATSNARARSTLTSVLGFASTTRAGLMLPTDKTLLTRLQNELIFRQTIEPDFEVDMATASVDTGADLLASGIIRQTVNLQIIRDNGDELPATDFSFAALTAADANRPNAGDALTSANSFAVSIGTATARISIARDGHLLFQGPVAEYTLIAIVQRFAVDDFALNSVNDAMRRADLVSLMAGATAAAEQLSYGDLKDTPGRSTGAIARAGTSTDRLLWNAPHIRTLIRTKLSTMSDVWLTSQDVPSTGTFANGQRLITNQWTRSTDGQRVGIGNNADGFNSLPALPPAGAMGLWFISERNRGTVSAPNFVTQGSVFLPWGPGSTRTDGTPPVLESKMFATIVLNTAAEVANAGLTREARTATIEYLIHEGNGQSWISVNCDDGHVALPRTRIRVHGGGVYLE